MRKISDHLKEIINSQPYLLFGFNHGLFNLTKLAKFLKPYIEAQTKKDVRDTAILMTLSRLKISKTNNSKNTHKILNLSVHSNLCSLTYARDGMVLKKVNDFFSKANTPLDFTSLNTSTTEITIITTEDIYKQLNEEISNKPKSIKTRLSSISVQFKPSSNNPGLLYFLIQQISVQNINIQEISSTYSELIFFLDKKDINLAFETFNTLLGRR